MALPKIVVRFLIPWRTYVAILVPILLSRLAVDDEASHRCAYVVIMMIIFWITEALPLPVTSLLPAILFPVLGIMTTSETCSHYLKDTNMLFIAALMAAVAVEYSGLHHRIALKVILVVGTTPMRLLIGLMLTTMFLSMWMVNSATTALMAPIVGAIVEELKASRPWINSEAGKTAADGEPEVPDDETKGFYIAIAYGATLGGIGTIIGTGTNISMKAIEEEAFPESKALTFLTWMYFGVPFMLVATFVVTLFLLVFYMSLGRKKTPAQIANFENASFVRGVIRAKYNAMGSVTFHEAMVSLSFGLLILLWLFRSPAMFKGWASLLYDTEIKDASPAIFIIIILFILPCNLNFLDRNQPYDKPTRAVLSWPLAQVKTPWSLVLLIGGSFAMAQGMKKSTLSSKMGVLLANMRMLPTSVIMMITSFFTSVISQFSSNVGGVNIALPVLAHMSKEMQVHPLYLMLPATVGASLAFMLPVSTPPNAIVLEAGHLHPADLMKAGSVVLVLTLTILYTMFLSLGVAVYNLNEMPDYAKNKEDVIDY